MSMTRSIFYTRFFFILFGWIKIHQVIKKESSHWALGSFFIIFGFLLLFGRLDMIDFSFWDIYKLWPLIIIYFGLQLISDRFKTFKGLDDPTRSSYMFANEKRHYSVGTFEYKEPNWKLKPTHLHVLAGDFYFDFSKAMISNEEVPLQITCLAGDIQMLMPEDLAFRVDASVRAGQIGILNQKEDGINRRIVYETPGYEQATKRVNIQIRIKAGSNRILHI